MEGWKYWEGKKVFIILKNKRNYSGIILAVETTSSITWISLKDKFNNRITFSANEIELIQEEENVNR